MTNLIYPIIYIGKRREKSGGEVNDMDLLEMRQKLNMGYNLKDLELRVTYYSRVSTDHLEQIQSLNNQNEHFEKMIKDNSNWQYVEGYVDEGITGTSDVRRENFMRMIADSKKNKFDLIITKEISRFSRNTLDSIKYTRELLNRGVAVFFLNDNINTFLPDSELRLTIMASLAQDEVRRLSERVKFGMHRSQENGHILGNDMLYGYKKDRVTGNLKIIEEEATVIKKIYDMYIIDDLSFNAISRRLNYDGIKTRQNKNWSSTSISRIIKNPKYKGYYCGKKVEVVDYMTKRVKHLPEEEWIVYEDVQKIPPIITEQTWDLAHQKSHSRRNERTKNVDSDIYNGKIYCAHCHKPFYKRHFRKKKSDMTWVCSKYLTSGKRFCDSPKVRESELKVIISAVSDVFLSKKQLIKTLLDIYLDNVDEDISEPLKEIQVKKNHLLELNLNGIITDEELLKKREELNTKEKEIVRDHSQDLDLERVENALAKRMSSKEILDDIDKLLIDQIWIDKSDDKIIVDLYLNVTGSDIVKDFRFKRGFDTSSTKRYEIDYLVKYHYQKEVDEISQNGQKK